MAAIPANDLTTPRWLLDLHEWKVQPYTDVSREILDTEGYGIVSYTWGYIADYENLATDTPQGIQWDVPGTQRWPLSNARNVMNKIGTRYMWWDWMCVPQGGRGAMKKLSPELEKVKGEEIAKQMHIYRNAKKSIIWLHSTFWKDESALKALLLQRPRDGNPPPTTTLERLRQMEEELRAAQNGENWLCSGWTLQEGVLLGPTHLVDVNGGKLQGESFFHGGYASVLDITTPITHLAIKLAREFFIHAESQDINGDTTTGQLAQLLDNPDSAAELRRSLKTLISSGLVGYTEFSPLYILAGKQSRTFGFPKDAYFALLGAMGLDDIGVDYCKPIGDINKAFLVALIKRYQWTMLLLPLPDENLVKELHGQQLVTRNFRWSDIADGVLLPIGVFIDTLIKAKVQPTNPTPLKDPKQDPEEQLRLSLPILSFENTLIIKAREGMTLTLFNRGESGEITWFRHYRQNADGLRIVSPEKNTAAEVKDNLIEMAWFLPLEDLETRDNIVGKRCFTLLEFNGNPPDSISPYGNFGGIADIWMKGAKTVEVQEIEVSAA